MSSPAADPRPVVAVTGLAFEARIATGPGVRTLSSGGDLCSLEAALEREFALGARAIMSFGIAGGLNATAAPGTWVVADNVVTRTQRWPADAAWSAALAKLLPRAVRGNVAGVDAMVLAPAEKYALGHATGAFAVDMESHVVATYAAKKSIPFAVFRVIADPMTRPLSAAATLGMRRDGTIDHRAVLASLLRNPGQLATLTRNAIDARTAVRSLLRGRRLLGAGLGYPDLG